MEGQRNGKDLVKVVLWWNMNIFSHVDFYS